MMRVTFSPFTAEPQYIQSVATEAVATQMQFALAAWEAHLRFVEALGTAALAAQWSMVELMVQAQTRRG